MRSFLILPVVLIFAGCSGNGADIPSSWLAVIEAEAAKAPEQPAECAPKSDPKWIEPPERDVLRDEAVRRDRQNKNNFNILRGKRRVCAAGLANNVEAANAQR